MDAPKKLPYLGNPIYIRRPNFLYIYIRASMDDLHEELESLFVLCAKRELI
jgi:hypothetical protein